jgi:hypothetical protein
VIVCVANLSHQIISALQKPGTRVKWPFEFRLGSAKTHSPVPILTNPDRFSTIISSIFRHVDGAGLDQPSHRVTGTMVPSLLGSVQQGDRAKVFRETLVPGSSSVVRCHANRSAVGRKSDAVKMRLSPNCQSVSLRNLKC